jgi:hypothetical protein
MFSDKNIRIYGLGVFIGMLIYLSCTIGGAMLGQAQRLREHPQDYTADEMDRIHKEYSQPIVQPQPIKHKKGIELI